MEKSKKVIFFIVVLGIFLVNILTAQAIFPGEIESVVPTCVIDLDNNTYMTNSQTRFRFVAYPEDHKAVLLIRLDRVLYTSALINAKYTRLPEEMTINIGDSATNSGYGGDGGTQSNDAEFQIVDTTLSVYGNDYMYAAEGTNFIHDLPNVLQNNADPEVATAAQTVSFLVANENMTVEYPSIQYTNSCLYTKQAYDSPYLFALAGQADKEGMVNYDIFAGFNRSIYDETRVGSGLGYVVITLVSNPNPVCVIDLDENTYETNTPDRFVFTALPENNMAALKIALDAEKYRSAEFEVTYGAEIADWTLNIGDSATNNGEGGDGVTQSNDAELQIRDKEFKLFGNDLMYQNYGFNFLYDVPDVVEEGETITIKVANCNMKLDNRNGSLNTKSPYLYALAGQRDWEGPVNYDIYAGFNRTIGSPGRTGCGVSKVIIILKPVPAVPVVDFPVSAE